MDFAPTMPWKSRFITRWAGFRNRNRPIVSARQGKERMSKGTERPEMISKPFNQVFPSFSLSAAHSALPWDFFVASAHQRRSNFIFVPKSRTMRSTKPRKPMSTSSDPDFNEGGIFTMSGAKSEPLPYRRVRTPLKQDTGSAGCWFLVPAK